MFFARFTQWNHISYGFWYTAIVLYLWSLSFPFSFFFQFACKSNFTAMHLYMHNENMLKIKEKIFLIILIQSACVSFSFNLWFDYLSACSAIQIAQIKSWKIIFFIHNKLPVSYNWYFSSSFHAHVNNQPANVNQFVYVYFLFHEIKI